MEMNQWKQQKVDDDPYNDWNEDDEKSDKSS